VRDVVSIIQYVHLWQASVLTGSLNLRSMDPEYCLWSLINAILQLTSLSLMSTVSTGDSDAFQKSAMPRVQHSPTEMCGTLTIASATMRASNSAPHSSSPGRVGPFRASETPLLSVCSYQSCATVPQ